MLLRRRRVIRFLKIISLLIFCAFIVHSITTLLIGRKVRAEITNIKACGEPVSYAELISPPIPDRENAAHVYCKIYKAYTDMDKHGKRYQLIDPLFHPSDAPSEKPVESYYVFYPWSDLAFALPCYDQLLIMIEKAAAIPLCRFEFENYGPFQTSKKLRNLSSLTCVLREAAFLYAKAEMQGEAVRCVVALAEIDNHLASQPSSQTYGTRISVARKIDGAIRDITRFGKINEATAQQLLNALDQIELNNGIREAMFEDRIRAIEWFRYLKKIKVPPCLCNKWIKERRQQSYLFRPQFYKDELFCLRAMAREISNSKLTYREISTKPEKFPDYASNAPSYAVFSTDKLASLRDIRRMRDLSMAYIAVDKAFLALLIYHSRFHTFPETLDKLESSIGVRLPKDPFSGKALAYKRVRNGCLIYSYGMNLRDDGGRIIPGRLYSSSESNYKQDDDIVWKLTEDPSHDLHLLMQPYVKKAKPIPYSSLPQGFPMPIAP